MSLAAPPTDGSYPSVTDALNALNAFAAVEGYALVKRRSKSWAGAVRAVWLKCDKGGKKKDYTSTVSKDKQRVSGSRLTECPFLIVLRLQDNQWKVDLQNADHNHVATQAIAHPAHRQLSPSRRAEIERQCDVGILPRQTHTSLLLAHTSSSSSSKAPAPIRLTDIHNARASHRALKRGNRSAIQAFIEDLEGEDWYSQYQTDPHSTVVKRVFLAYNKSLDLLKDFPEVLLMDCTYKTNKYNMPLLTITGVTALRRSFSIGMAFLGKETVEEFQWVLSHLRCLYQKTRLRTLYTVVTDCDLALINAISIVFPSIQHLLCL